MEFKPAVAALTGVAFVLVLLGLITGGAAFYAASCLALAAVAVDLARYLWLVRDLKRNLVVSRTLSGMGLLLGSSVTVSYDLAYRGRRKVPVRCVQPADPGVHIAGSPVTIEIGPGHHALAFAARPAREGRQAVKSLRMTVETFLFRGTVTAGGDAVINVYLAMGQDSVRTGAWRGRARRLQLPGSEALRQGSGIDFSCVRDFTPGDSTRNIDWARSSRSPALVVRAFEDEHTLPLLVLIDVDPSMDRGIGKTGLESAVELATLLASQVLLGNERVGLACFSRSDITSYLAPAGGKDQMSRIRTALSSQGAVGGDNFPRSGFPTLQEAEAVRRMFRGTAAEAAFATFLEETIRQFSANVREDGFVKAIAQASLSARTPCSIVVITNLSMGRGQPDQRHPDSRIPRPQRGRRADTP